MQPAIQTHGLSVVLAGNQILENVTFQISVGSIVGLVGPSGAGKTTLIRVLLGLQKPSKGTVVVLGQAPGSRSLRSAVGYVTQAPSVYADLTVVENLEFFASLLGAPRQQVHNVLKQVELDRQARQIVSTLSGGQLARVSLAVALLGKPKLLLLDEPTVGLDPLLRQKLWTLFRDLAAQGITILISSHAMDEASKCDELLFIRGGNLLATDTPKAIRHQTDTTDLEAAFIALASETSKTTGASRRPA